MILHNIVHALSGFIHHVVEFVIGAICLAFDFIASFWMNHHDFDALQTKRKQDAERRAASGTFFKQRHDDKNKMPPTSTLQ